jgi:hypothetical protein
MKRFFDSNVIDHQRYELVFMRLGVAVTIFLSLPTDINFTSQIHPNGLAHFIDLTFLANDQFWFFCRWMTLFFVPFYTAGVAFLPIAAWFFFVTISSGTLNNSQGAITHSLQPIGLLCLGQFLFALFLLMKRTSLRDKFLYLTLADQRIHIHIAKVALASCYVTTAITKIIVSNGKWIWLVPNLAVQVVKTNMDWFHNKGIAPTQLITNLPELMVHHPMITRLLIGPVLFLELFAFLLLLGRRTAFFLALLLICMHEGIYLTMKLTFWNWQLLLFILFINLPYCFVRFFNLHR